jgi:PGF-CTERM protein
MKLPIKKELKWIFRLAIAIGIVAYLSKFAKKAAPVAAACLVASMPLTGIGVNVASAQEHNSSQYPVVDLPLIEQQDTEFTVSCHEYKVYPYGRQSRIVDIDPYYYKEECIRQGYYSTLLAILMEAEQGKNSEHSIYNEEFLNKYFDSLRTDAKRAGKIAVKSIIPTPEGQILNEISKGVYGDISDINTAAQLGVILNNMTKTSAKMLEETRKTDSTVKSYEYDPYNWKIDGVRRDAVTYYTLREERIKDNYHVFKGYDRPVRNKELKNAYNSLHLVPVVGRGNWHLKDSKGDAIDFISVEHYPKSYGLSLPEALDFIDVPITPREQEELAKIKGIARGTYIKTISGELVGLPPTYQAGEISADPSPYKYLGSTGLFVTQLRKVSFDYQQFTLNANYIRVPAPMVPHIKSYTSEEFRNYLDDLIYEINNPPSELKEGGSPREEYFNLWHKERANIPSGISKEEYNLWQKELLKKILQPSIKEKIDFEIGYEWNHMYSKIPELGLEVKEYHVFFFRSNEPSGYKNEHYEEQRSQAEYHIRNLSNEIYRNRLEMPSLKILDIGGESYIQMKVNESYYALLPEPKEEWDFEELRKSVHHYIENTIIEHRKLQQQVHESPTDQQENIPTPTPALLTPKPSSSPSKELTPGFEVIFAIMGLLAVAYLLRRRK